MSGDGVIIRPPNPNPAPFEKHNLYPMKRNTFAAIGGYQPFLFAIGMYFVALFFSIFICSAIFYAFNPKKTMAKEDGLQQNKTVMISSQPVFLSVANK